LVGVVQTRVTARQVRQAVLVVVVLIGKTVPVGLERLDRVSPAVLHFPGTQVVRVVVVVAVVPVQWVPQVTRVVTVGQV
jgi:hypothetical protein